MPLLLELRLITAAGALGVEVGVAVGGVTTVPVGVGVSVGVRVGVAVGPPLPLIVKLTLEMSKKMLVAHTIWTRALVVFWAGTVIDAEPLLATPLARATG